MPSTELFRNFEMMNRWKQNSLIRRLKLQAMNRLAVGGVPEKDIEKLAGQLVDNAVIEFKMMDRILDKEGFEKLKDRMIELTNPHI